MARKVRRKTADPRPRRAAGEPVEELSCDGQSVPCQAGRPDSATRCGVARQRVFPCRRMRRPRRVLKTPVPPAFGTPAAARCPDTGHDIGSLLCHARDLAPRPVAFCTPDRSSGPRGYRAPQRNGRRGYAPPSRATATWRSVPLRRVDRSAARLRRGTWDTFRCHLTPDTWSGNAPVRRRVSAADCTTPSLLPHQPRV